MVIWLINQNGDLTNQNCDLTDQNRDYPAKIVIWLTKIVI